MTRPTAGKATASRSRSSSRASFRAGGPVAVALLGACLTWSLPGFADEEPTAESLFREGRHLLANGQLAEACDKFAESQRKEPSAGALLNLARCHADAGMTATAWTEYLEAARLARTHERPQQAAEAELRATELQPRLMRLRIQLDLKTPGVVVSHNGEPLAASDVNIPMIVDPGSHVVRATAPGYTEWSTTVVVTQPGQMRTVPIPALTPLPTTPPVAPVRDPSAPSSAAVAPAAAEKPGISARTWVAAGVGAAAFVTSGVLAVLAKSKWDDAHDTGSCDTSHSCNRDGLQETDQARRFGNVATGLAAVGVAAAGCTVLFYMSDTAHHKAPVQARVAVGPAGVVLGVHGGF